MYIKITQIMLIASKSDIFALSITKTTKVI